MAINIGQIVKEKYESNGIAMVDFAKRLNTSKQNIYNIFERDTIDSGLLMKIGKILNYNFFQDLADYQNQTMDVLLQQKPKLVSMDELDGWKIKCYEISEDLRIVNKKYIDLLEQQKIAITDFSKISMNEATP